MISLRSFVVGVSVGDVRIGGLLILRLACQAVSHDDASNLFDLICLVLAATGLEIENFCHAVSCEDVMVATRMRSTNPN
jgi:hypothetical protein